MLILTVVFGEVGLFKYLTYRYL